MKTPTTLDGVGGLPEGVPSQHLPNIRLLHEAFNREPTARAGGLRGSPLRLAETGGAGRAAYRLAREAKAEPVTKPFALPTKDLHFSPAQPTPESETREWQLIGTIKLGAFLAMKPLWIDMLCMARQGTAYTVLPLSLEDLGPHSEGQASDVVRLVLHREPGAQVSAQQLREAFAKTNGVLAASTDAGAGMFLSLVFEVG
jgi:hypothetical protein